MSREERGRERARTGRAHLRRVYSSFLLQGDPGATEGGESSIDEGEDGAEDDEVPSIEELG